MTKSVAGFFTQAILPLSNALRRPRGRQYSSITFASVKFSRAGMKQKAQSDRVMDVEAAMNSFVLHLSVH
jgi:hypothetical protein